MKFHASVRPVAAVLAAALLAGTALAQSRPSPAPLPVPGVSPIVTDTGLPPAESRDSHGAIVLDNTPPPMPDTTVMGAPPAVKVVKPAKVKPGTVGTENDKLRRKGAGSLVEQ